MTPNKTEMVQGVPLLNTIILSLKDSYSLNKAYVQLKFKKQLKIAAQILLLSFIFLVIAILQIMQFYF